MIDRRRVQLLTGPSGLSLIAVFALVFVVELVLDRAVRFWEILLVYLAVYFVTSLLLRRGEADERPGPNLPLPGPGARSGVAVFHAKFLLSANLAILNPFQILQTLAQLGGQVIVYARSFRGAPTAETYRHKARYLLPFRGDWLVFQGGVEPETSHSWRLFSQRYAYDLVRADPTGRRHEGAGDRLQDYLCYGEGIVAAADGVVVGVRDGVRDGPWPGTGWVDFLSRDFRGNWVTVRHAPGEYGFYAHLIPGTIPVASGDPVRAGEVLGRCGSSGHSTEPHLHFQMQDRPSFFLSMGLPIRFHGVVVDGQTQAGGAWLRGGMRVRPAQEDAATPTGTDDGG